MLNKKLNLETQESRTLFALTYAMHLLDSINDSPTA